MHKFQYKFTILNFLTCMNLHMNGKLIYMGNVRPLVKGNRFSPLNYFNFPQLLHFNHKLNFIYFWYYSESTVEHRPNFVSPLSKLVLQSELPRGYKIPKFIHTSSCFLIQR